ncbi:MAG TPA: serine/threonine-protein kinase [Polyangiaceae bacterium]|nr:serine/threonine-protein kinase [Polyangiaceae bacterium]
MADDLFGIIGTIQGGAFRVEEVVAEGGFAVVYRAYHSAFRSNVALKCLKIPRTFSESEQAEFLEKFREEAELLFRLSSAIPSVVRPLQVGTLSETQGRFVPFLALEWLDGETLDKTISNRVLAGEPPLDLGPAVRLLTPVADALCRAHRLPTRDGIVTIIHRDLKPENIFLAEVAGKKVTKVLDFGIAKVKNAATQVVGKQSASESPLAAFTPAYGAPEQWLPKRFGQTGPWTDVWGLALTAVETLCGHTPLDGDQAAMMGQAIDPARRPTPRNEGVRVADRVEAIFARALAVDPRQRYADVATFWNELCEAAGMPQVVGDRSPSLAPPVVPVLEASPVSSARGAAPPSSAGGAPPSAAGAAERAKRRAPEPKHVVSTTDDRLFGATLEAPDDVGPALRLKTSAPPAVRARGPASLARPIVARTTSELVRPGYGKKQLGLAGPLKLLAVAMAMMAGDYAYAAAYGEHLRFGPARVFWVAGPIAAIGTVLLLVRLLGAED